MEERGVLPTEVRSMNQQKQIPFFSFLVFPLFCSSSVSAANAKMAFQDNSPIRVKIVLNEEPAEQVSKFKYLGYSTKLDHLIDFNIKRSNFQYMCGTIKQMIGGTRRTKTIQCFTVVKRWLYPHYCMDQRALLITKKTEWLN
jgi:hypothetical protein